jgi:ADP-ribose pyrophosphatase
MNRRVEILHKRDVFQKSIFRIEEVRLRFERFDGSMSEEITRFALDRRDSVAVLLHDRDRGQVLLTEQFRYPTYEHGPGWLLELPAGTMDAGEDAESCARRETMEETGYLVRDLHRIASPYLSPGGSSERVHLFQAEVKLGDRVGAGGGVAGEGEDIRLVTLPVEEALECARDGRIEDAKTLIALQWLALNARSATR